MSRLDSQEFSFCEGFEQLDGQDIILRLKALLPDNPHLETAPTYLYDILLPDGRPAGAIDLRVGYTNDLVLYTGHIGYHILPPYRGRQLALHAVEAIAPVALAHGMQWLIITTDPDNIPSRRVCEKLDARYLGQVALPQWHDLSLTGSTAKCRYLWMPGKMLVTPP